MSIFFETYLFTPKLIAMKVQTRAVHFSADQKLLSFVQKKLEKLEHFFDQIVDAIVVMKLENSGKKVKDKVVEIRLKVPGTVLITKETHKTFEAAIENSLPSLKRQLIKHKELMRKK